MNGIQCEKCKNCLEGILCSLCVCVCVCECVCACVRACVRARAANKFSKIMLDEKQVNYLRNG